jgi:very-long-chain enoyl-CoA reductase
MVGLYAPAMLVGMYSMGSPLGNRAQLVSFMIAVHFAKRVLECAFLHKYSGKMPLTTAVTIAAFYGIIAMCACHFAGMAEPIQRSGPQSMLRWVSLLLFTIGLLGNFYHHYLLATLRQPGETTYKVPHGGFFDLLGGVATPHYTFEIVGWVGVALASQHYVMVMNLVAMVIYLMDRAVAQSEWNRTALKEEYPKTRKHIFPMVF